ncbi:MAG: HD domain-containing protein [Muribaculaceae bacterium]|nr:HD domain-containing protein [Muribaculaceae bacterium]MCM1493610.1 HD domain-containing protein [Muribaculaceae bacterium]
MCKYKQAAMTKAGKPYDNVILQDKTGTIDAKVWDPGSAGIDEFEAMDYVAVTGDVINYQGSLQMSIKRARVAGEGEYEPKNYLPATEKDVEEMYAELMGFVDSVENIYLNRLLHMFFDNESFARSFKTHSAAKSVHHGFVGGLLEHTVSVTRNCDFFAGNYPLLKRDLLLTAAMFHDIGKLKELSTFPENDYTDAGQLIGHIVIGTEWIGEAMREIEGFPQTLANELKHCILAHHGELEFGSPKKPALIEALALSFADNLDAKMETFKELISSVKENDLEWQGYNRLLESNIRRTSN